MRILCIYPGMDFALNDNAHMLKFIKQSGFTLMVICSKLCDLKSSEQLPACDMEDGIPIYRIYNNYKEQGSIIVKKYKTVYLLAKAFRPDIIFCSQQFNMFIAKRLQRDMHVPIVLLVEFAKDPFNLLKRKWYLGLRILAPAVAAIYWRWLTRTAKIIITSNPEDVKFIPSLVKNNVTLLYLPWCTHIPEEIQSYHVQKKQDRFIYVGSISKWKNTHEFIETIPLIFNETHLRKFVIIGPILEGGNITAIMKKFSNHIIYYPSLPRNDTLKLIKESYISYTPVKLGGWGFIGDSWGVKTPLIVTHNNYKFNNKKDAIVVDKAGHIHHAINELLNNPELYRNIQEGGWSRYLNLHSAQSVGKKLYTIFEKAVA